MPTLKQKLGKLLGYAGPPKEPFILKETEPEKTLAKDGDIKGDTATVDQPHPKRIKPQKIGELKKQSEVSDPNLISADLDFNKQRLEKLFHLPLNKDVILRQFTVGMEPGIEALLIYIEGMADKSVINNTILKPLMMEVNLDPFQGDGLLPYHRILFNYLPSSKVSELTGFQEVLGEVVTGATVIFFAGSGAALAIETRGFDFRQVGTAVTEQVVQGPQEGFVENLRSNLTLLRKILNSENLVTEFLTIGKTAKANIALAYLVDLANPALVKEVKRRINSIKTDFLPEPGMLEEFIEDYPYSLVPQTFKTERPDRVASLLAEGKVAILVNHNPFVLVVPATFFDFLHSPEDYYVRYPYGVWMRLLRVAAIFLALLLPAFYIAIATFHQEMIPTDLLLAIAASRERVPFPTIVEILLMELSFELIREAGVRVPGVVGPTIGIVGTLIIGQAAVAASIVSPILIIVAAVTGLASFAIPNYTVAFGFRFMRFFFIFLAATLGFFGISTGLVVLLCLLISMQSFGVPYFAPVAPSTGYSSDLVTRAPMWNQEIRPDYVQAQEQQRQPNISRGWTKGEQNPSDPKTKR